jgi:hypothetical protein
MVMTSIQENTCFANVLYEMHLDFVIIFVVVFVIVVVVP